MFVAIVVCDVIIYESSSLKMKRSVLGQLKGRFFSKFRVPLYEVGCQDSWNHSEIAFALISSEHRHSTKFMRAIRSFLKDFLSMTRLSGKNGRLSGWIFHETNTRRSV